MAAIHVLLMENTMQFKSDSSVKYIFDLKGSSVNREVTGKIKNTTTLKDMNFLSLKRKHQNRSNTSMINLPSSEKQKIKAALKKDSQFLAR
jgi:competence CoiA-like predicted nuclease